jgi:hypothetical protein
MQVSANANFNVKVEHNDQMRAALEHAFHRIIDARGGEQASVVIDARANREPQPRVGEPQSPAAAPQAQAEQSPAPDSKADNVVPLRSVVRSVGPSVPGLDAGVALDAADDGLSTTEKFLRWNGHVKPP